MNKVTSALIQSKVDSVKGCSDKLLKANNNEEREECMTSIIEHEREREEQKKEREKLYSKRSKEREKLRQKYAEKYGISQSSDKKKNIKTEGSVARTSSIFAKQTEEMQDRENRCPGCHIM